MVESYSAVCAKAFTISSNLNARLGVSSIEVEQPRIIGRAHHDQDVAEILGGGTDHTRSADVDLLDELVEGRARLLRRLRERVQVDDDEVDEADAVFGQRLQIVRDGPGARGCRRAAPGAAF